MSNDVGTRFLKWRPLKTVTALLQGKDADVSTRQPPVDEE